MRVHTRTKQARGASRRCGRAGCGREILPGEKYHQFTFFRGAAQFRCADHYPKQSEMTQSRMADVYAAIEDAEEEVDALTTVEEAEELVGRVAEAVEEVAQEYRDADDAFGGQSATEAGQRADELESWAQDLQGFATDATEPAGMEGEDEMRDRVIEKMREDGFSEDDPAEWESVLDARMQEAQDEAEDDPDLSAEREEFLEQLRSDVREALGGCPL